MCEELKGRELIVSGGSYNMIYFRGTLTNKIYGIDFVNQEYVMPKAIIIFMNVYWMEVNYIFRKYNKYVYYFHAKTHDTVLDTLNSEYAILESYGFVYVYTPVADDLDVYYESYYF